jgi:hypothetical protein
MLAAESPATKEILLFEVKTMLNRLEESRNG